MTDFQINLPKKAGRTKLLADLGPEEEQQPKKVTLHEIRYDSKGPLGNGLYCTCGARKAHNRGKVLIAWLNKHIQKTGHKFVEPS